MYCDTAMYTAHVNVLLANQTCPIKLVVFLPELCYPVFVMPEIHFPWSHPSPRFRVHQVTYNLCCKIPVHMLASKRSQQPTCNLPREFSSTLVAFVHHTIFRVRGSRLAGAFNNVAISAFAFMVKLNHKVWEIWNHGTPEASRTLREVDQLPMLRPLGFRGQNRFLPGNLGLEVRGYKMN